MKRILVVLISVMCAAGVMAEGQRGGFYLSGGLGLHSTEWTITDSDYDVSIAVNSGMHSSLKIGGYIGRKWALYFQREASWWSAYDSNAMTDELVAAGLVGVGASYYFLRRTGSPFLEFALGFGDIASSGDYSETSVLGGAALMGAGFEFNDHMQASVVLTSVNGSDLDSYYYTPSHETMSTAIKLELKL